MISIVIPNYNGAENLKNNLPKLLDSVRDIKSFEIIISDDASTDGSLKVLEEFAQKNPRTKVVIIKNEQNKGFSTNVNRGFLKASGDIVVLLNTDAYPKSNFLDAVMKDFEDKDVFAVGFMDESIENGKIVPRGRGIGEWKRGFLSHSAGDLNFKNNLWASGGSSGFRKSIWDKLDGLNTIYNPFYWEDIDISYRALRSGYKILFEKNAVVVHEHEKGVIKNKFSASKIKTVAFRNQFVFVWINASGKLVISNLLWLPYNMLKSLRSGNLEFFSGFFKFLLLLPKVLSSRSKVQKVFVKKDSEVIITK